MRDAIRSGDRAGAMQIAAFAEEKGLPAQASIGSSESRLATSYQQTGSEAAKRAEMGAALDAGQTEEPAATTGQSRTAANMLARPDMGAEGPRMPASPAEPPPVAPGATPPPENPVSGSSVPPVSDVRTRLSQRSSFAPQGLAGRQAFDANLQKSIETGGRDISEGRFANMQKEAARLGVSREQLLTRLQDMGGVSLPGSAVAQAPDTRSLDQRLQSYQDEYLGGGTAAELPGKLREDAASNRTAAEGLARARVSSERARVAAEREVATDAEGSRRRTEGLMTPGATTSADPNLVSGFEKPQAAPAAAPAPGATPSIPFRLGQAARSFSNANFPDTAVAAAEGFVRRERSGYERIAAAGEAKVDEGIAKVRRVAGLAALRVTGRNRRTADTLRRVREEFAAGRAGTPAR
jgi:hypothetical protein